MNIQDINDFGQPLKDSDLLRYEWSTLSRLGHPGRRLAAFMVIYIVLIVSSTWFDVNIILASVLSYLAAQVLSTTKFSPQRANTEVKDKNKEIYQRLYSDLESNRWTELLIGLGALRNFDFYAQTSDETVLSLRTFLKETHNMGSSNCLAGHHPTCIHRIPAPLLKWLNN